MYRIYTATLTILTVVIVTLTTQSWGLWVMAGSITILAVLVVFIIAHYSTKQTSQNIYIPSVWKQSWLIVLTWAVSITLIIIRLLIYDTHCRSIPTQVQWSVVVDSILKAGQSVIISDQWYHRIYRTSQSLSIWNTVTVYATTQPLVSCISTYSHRDVWLALLSAWIRGGDFDYDQWLSMKWVDGYIVWSAVIEWNGDEPIIDQQGSLVNTVTTLRSWVITRIRWYFVSDRVASWVAGTLIGDKELINKSDYDLLIDSWLVHLIVVSGGNLALIMLLLNGLLFWVPQKIRYFIIAGVLWLYVMIVGTDSSVLRAAVMAGLTIVGILSWREISFRLSISVVIIWLLLYHPLMIYDVWLRLSLGAVIAISIVYQWIYRLTMSRWPRRYIRRARRSVLLIAASTWAWIGTMPVLVRQFGWANITSIIANIAAHLLASYGTILQIILMTIGMILPNRLIDVRVAVISWIVETIYQIASLWVQRWVWIGVSSWRGMIALIWSVGILLIWCYHHTQQLRVRYLLEIEEDI